MNCPYCGKKINPQSIRCRWCGHKLISSSLPPTPTSQQVPSPAILTTTQMMTRIRRDLPNPKNWVWYFIYGLIATIVFPFVGYGFLFLAAWSELLTATGMLILVLIWFFGTSGAMLYWSFKGWSGKKLTYFIVLLLCLIFPLVGWIVTYYVGKGAYRVYTKQDFVDIEEPIFKTPKMSNANKS